jgi:hypothetical protein
VESDGELDSTGLLDAHLYCESHGFGIGSDAGRWLVVEGYGTCSLARKIVAGGMEMGRYLHIAYCILQVAAYWLLVVGLVLGGLLDTHRGDGF